MLPFSLTASVAVRNARRNETAGYELENCYDKPTIKSSNPITSYQSLKFWESIILMILKCQNTSAFSSSSFSGKLFFFTQNDSNYDKGIKVSSQPSARPNPIRVIQYE